MPPRRVFWLQLLIGWLPVGALFVTMMVTAHPELTFHAILLASVRMMVSAAALGLIVHRLTERFPWPHPFQPRFVAIHLVGALLYSTAFVLLNSLIESLLRGQLIMVMGIWLGRYMVLGVWLYVMVAGVAYATRATERAARAEATAARSQLAALRAQLNPHFLFNALHTVVQLIPREPRRAAQAAELVAALLRTTIEEDRDLVTLGEEWSFVERYLDVERIRFGDRLVVQADLTDDARAALIPSFALQTLVENAVRHGAAPRVEPTAVTVRGGMAADALVVIVHDNGSGATPEQISANGGTGLQRLRDRLSALYGSGASLKLDGRAAGFSAELTIPQRSAERMVADD